MGRIFLNVPSASPKPTFTVGSYSPTPKTSKICLSGATCSYVFDP
jgi:hypothetical protein